MKNKYRISYVAALGVFLLWLCSAAKAADLPAADNSLIKSAGIPVYSGAEFVNGGQDVGFRFATSKSPDEVRSWYREQMPSWTLYSEYGGWILHDGKEGLGLGQLMQRKQVQVQENGNLSDWFGIDKSKSTEIVIMIPR